MTDCIKNKTFFFFRNFTGAFSDGAILFPLLATLSSVSNFSGTLLLLSSAVLYIGSGLFFKVPMSVQPLKAIVKPMN
ncbi:MAG: hypothetical protein HY072_03765 [Deltaproteobacteria bacterium]|nr:hypothetical protein [Deltaproteobacteria bacterium]